ncbi:MAG: hypothetical protein NWF07_14805 [Candidatus Bathyarchaeota archaeon]|nr:hypothetical protein [Candidatus Bathyarchaeota archaeon]
MSSKAGFLIALILGTAIGAATVYAALYIPVQATITQQQSTITTLTNENTQLTSQLTELNEDYDNLRTQYTAKTHELTELQTDYGSLRQDYEQTYTDWITLSEDVLDFYNYIQSYVNTEDSFKRVYTTTELEKIADTIEDVTRMEDDNWQAYWYIHQYVRDEIQYAYDEEIPVITTYTYYPDAPDTQLTGFQTSTRENYLQNLDYTIEYQQGDCDDQAMLEYAMIQYYGEYIYGTQYRLYLAMITFNNGISHLAVFMPVQNNQICILDPSGNYQTGTWTSITAKTASTELTKYDTHWTEEGGIQEITLYQIDIDTGTYTQDFNGTPNQCITYLTTN